MNAAHVTSNHGSRLERFAQFFTNWTGGSAAFALALFTIVVWLVSGPFFHFSDTWQLVINTGTTIVTFLMVFLIQRSQNKEALAVQLKLNEIIAALKGASNRLINIEDLSEVEVRALHADYQRLAKSLEADLRPPRSHSIDEITSAENRDFLSRPLPSSFARFIMVPPWRRTDAQPNPAFEVHHEERSSRLLDFRPADHPGHSRPPDRAVAAGSSESARGGQPLQIAE